MKQEVQFKGICSGDGDSFCWEVDKETYIRICGWDECSPFDCVECEIVDCIPIAKSDRFRVYPNSIFGSSDTKVKRIKIEWEDIKE